MQASSHSKFGCVITVIASNKLFSANIFIVDTRHTAGEKSYRHSKNKPLEIQFWRSKLSQNYALLKYGASYEKIQEALSLLELRIVGCENTR